MTARDFRLSQGICLVLRVLALRITGLIGGFSSSEEPALVGRISIIDWMMGTLLTGPAAWGSIGVGGFVCSPSLSLMPKTVNLVRNVRPETFKLRDRESRRDARVR